MERGKNPKVDAFINELIVICLKHHLSLAHEDSHGAFIVQPFKEENIQWLQDAHDDTKI